MSFHLSNEISICTIDSRALLLPAPPTPSHPARTGGRRHGRQRCSSALSLVRSSVFASVVGEVSTRYVESEVGDRAEAQREAEDVILSVKRREGTVDSLGVRALGLAPKCLVSDKDQTMND